MKLKSEHRLILAVALSTVFFITWYVFFAPVKKVDPNVAVDQATTSGSTTSAPAAAPVATAPIADGKLASASVAATNDPQANVAVKTWTIKNNLVEVEFTSDGAIPTKWLINNYTSTTDPKSPLVDLVFQEIAPLTLSFTGADFSFPEKPRYELIAADEQGVTFSWKSKGIQIIKTVRLAKDAYTADVEVEVKNSGAVPVKGSPLISWAGMNLPPKGGSFMGIGSQPSLESATPAFYLDGKVKREADVFKMVKTTSKIGEVLWAGLESRYFLGALVPRITGSTVEYGANPISKEKGSTVWAGVSGPEMIVPTGDSKKYSYTLYVGPKDINNLKAAGAKLDEAIDYGWFTVIAVPILYALRFFHGLIGNYGLAIILLTIFVKLLLHPINVKSLKSMKGMQQLQPRLKELQLKYKDDKQKLNQETMLLFKAHKVNPMGGCLPMLAQFPIYIALYKVLWNSIELYHAPFFWFYKDLSAPDPYFITPILLGLFMVAQQKLTPSASADPAQQRMMMIMPVMFTAFMLFLPVGLVVYILVNTVMSVTQQYMYNNGIGIMDVIRRKRKELKV